MEFVTDISNLKDEDLPRYKDFLLDKILGDQPKERRKESFRSKVLDRVDRVHQEINKRNELRCSNTGGNTPESEN